MFTNCFLGGTSKNRRKRFPVTKREQSDGLKVSHFVVVVVVIVVIVVVIAVVVVVVVIMARCRDEEI